MIGGDNVELNVDFEHLINWKGSQHRAPFHFEENGSGHR